MESRLQPATGKLLTEANEENEANFPSSPIFALDKQLEASLHCHQLLNSVDARDAGS
jgi:hypothetical protein